MSKSAKSGSIEEAMSLIENKIGRGKIIFASDLYISATRRVPSGSLLLDAAMGGGYAIAALHILWGDTSSGKTTAALGAIAEFQRAMPKKYAMLVATEQFDAVNAAMNGVDLSRLVLIFPETGEEGFNAAEVLLRTQQISVFVLDSVEGMIPKAELEGSMEDQQRGAHARMLNKALRKMYSALQPQYDEKTKRISYESGTTPIFIQQMRVNQNAGIFHNPEARSGGKGIDHAAKIIVRFGAKSNSAMITKELQQKTIVVGVRKKTQCTKNNTYSPNNTANFDYYFSEHKITKFKKKRVFLPGFIDHSREIIELAFENSTLQGDPKNGFTLNGEKYKQHALEYFLDENPKEAYRLLKKTLSVIQPPLPKTLAKHYALRLKAMKQQRREKDSVSPISGKASKPVRVGQKRKAKKRTPSK